MTSYNKSKMRRTLLEKQWHWHFLHISINNVIFSWRKYRPIMDIRKNAFDLLWRGFQITWRYYGNARDCHTGVRLKDT